jgi:hypothetical protein
MYGANVPLNWEKNATETFEMLKVGFGDQTMRRNQTFEWLSKFKSSVTCAEMMNAQNIHQ